MALADTFQEILDSLPPTGPTSSSTCVVDEAPLHRGRDVPRDRATRSPTRTTTGTGGSSSPTSSATPPRRRPCTARCAARRGRASPASSRCARCAPGRVETSNDVGPAGVGAPGVPPPARAVAAAAWPASSRSCRPAVRLAACSRRSRAAGHEVDAVAGVEAARGGRGRRRRWSSTSPPATSTGGARRGAAPRPAPPDARRLRARRAGRARARAGGRVRPRRAALAHGARGRRASLGWPARRSPLDARRGRTTKPESNARATSGGGRRSRSASPTPPSCAAAPVAGRRSCRPAAERAGDRVELAPRGVGVDAAGAARQRASIAASGSVERRLVAAPQRADRRRATISGWSLAASRASSHSTSSGYGGAP